MNNVPRDEASSAECKMAVVAFVERLDKNNARVSKSGRDIGVPHAGAASDFDGSALEVKAVGYLTDKKIMLAVRVVLVTVPRWVPRATAAFSVKEDAPIGCSSGSREAVWELAPVEAEAKTISIERCDFGAHAKPPQLHLVQAAPQ